EDGASNDGRVKRQTSKCSLALGSTPAHCRDPLSSPARTWQNGGMRFMEIIRRLLFVTALLGIAVGPLSIGATHRAMASSGPSAMHATVDMGMSGDMPCCPE